MGEYVIPISCTAPAFDQPVTIDNQVFTFSFKYNVRASRWFLDISDQTDTPLVQGVCLQINRSLIPQASYLLLPNTALYCVDDSGSNQEPTLNSFLLTHSLCYQDLT